MKYYEKLLSGYHIRTCGHVFTIFIVNTPKLEVGSDLESMYKLYNFILYVYLLHS